MIFLRPLMALTLAMALAFACVSLQAAPLPAEVYAALPELRLPSLSPDGKLVAVIAPVKGKDTLVIFDVETQKPVRVVSTGILEPIWVKWKTNKRLLFGGSFFSNRDPFNPTVDTRLIAMDVDGTNDVNLVSPQQFADYIPQFQDRVLSFLPGDDDHVLIELSAVPRGQYGKSTHGGTTNDAIKYPQIMRVDVNTGKMDVYASSRYTVVHWYVDQAGNVRAGKTLEDKTEGYVVKLKDGSWHKIHPQEVNQGNIFNIVAMVEGNLDRIYVSSNHEGSGGLYEYDVNQDKFVATVAVDPSHAVMPIDDNGRLLGYRTNVLTSPVYVDPLFAQVSKGVDKAIPGSYNQIVSWSQDRSGFILKISHGNEPVSYWLMRITNNKPKLSPFFESYPALTEELIAPSKLTSYKARDGLEIPALLTLPVGYQTNSGKPLAFVVLPHGGPSTHDEPGFNFLVQFLINRGYGVLQPQFRGSTGFGAAFEAAGLQQWGLLMQDDVTDGTKWLIEQNLADPKRIAIVGSSYGGYSALMGAVKEPDLYRAAVAIAPVTDLRAMVRTVRKFIFKDVNVPRIVSDYSTLEKTSPASNVDKIKVPILLVHGKKDYTVPVEQTETMEEALKKAGKPAQVLYLDGADHSFSQGQDRIAMVKALEDFLAKNLPVN